MSRMLVPNLHTKIFNLTGTNFLFFPAHKHRTTFFIETGGDVFLWVGRDLEPDVSKWWHIQTHLEDDLFSDGVYGPLFMFSASSTQIKIVSPLVENPLIIEGPPTEPVPPTIDVPPSDLTVTEPDPATFSVVASHPTEQDDLFYQWMANIPDIGWINVQSVWPGRTVGHDTDTFTLDPTEAEDTDSVIACRVRAYENNGDYQILSPSAVLTVEAAEEPDLTTALQTATGNGYARYIILENDAALGDLTVEVVASYESLPPNNDGRPWFVSGADWRGSASGTNLQGAIWLGQTGPRCSYVDVDASGEASTGVRREFQFDTVVGPNVIATYRTEIDVAAREFRYGVNGNMVTVGLSEGRFFKEVVTNTEFNIQGAPSRPSTLGDTSKVYFAYVNKEGWGEAAWQFDEGTGTEAVSTDGNTTLTITADDPESMWFEVEELPQMRILIEEDVGWYGFNPTYNQGDMINNRWGTQGGDAEVSRFEVQAAGTAWFQSTDGTAWDGLENVIVTVGTQSIAMVFAETGGTSYSAHDSDMGAYLVANVDQTLDFDVIDPATGESILRTSPTQPLMQR